MANTLSNDSRRNSNLYQLSHTGWTTAEPVYRFFSITDKRLLNHGGVQLRCFFGECFVEGDSSRNIVRNSIRKTSTKNSWYDLFEEVTQQIDESLNIPSSVWNDFEKLASISVSSSQNGEQFHPDS